MQLVACATVDRAAKGKPCVASAAAPCHAREEKQTKQEPKQLQWDYYLKHKDNTKWKAANGSQCHAHAHIGFFLWLLLAHGS